MLTVTAAVVASLAILGPPPHPTATLHREDPGPVYWGYPVTYSLVLAGTAPWQPATYRVKLTYDPAQLQFLGTPDGPGTITLEGAAADGFAAGAQFMPMFDQCTPMVSFSRAELQASSGAVPMTERGGPCLADYDCDGIVEPGDFQTFLFAYSRGVADFNQDGVVNYVDFLAFLAAYSAGCP